MSKLAILGGQPAFDTKLDIVSPTLPRLEDIAGRVSEILSSGKITNYVKRYLLRHPQELIIVSLDSLLAVLAEQCCDV